MENCSIYKQPVKQNNKNKKAAQHWEEIKYLKTK